jgi:hypothetical protein
MALLDDNNTERLVDSPGLEEEEVTSLYATAKFSKVEEEVQNENPVFETAVDKKKGLSPLLHQKLSPKPSSPEKPMKSEPLLKDDDMP